MFPLISLVNLLRYVRPCPHAAHKSDVTQDIVDCYSLSLLNSSTSLNLKTFYSPKYSHFSAKSTFNT